MAAARAAADPRDGLVVEVPARTGRRASELCDLEADAVVRIGDGHWMRVPVGKLRNDRSIPLQPDQQRTKSQPDHHAHRRIMPAAGGLCLLDRSAFDASVQYESPGWSSLRIAGVRLGLNANPDDAGSRTGLHFVVDDLALACEAIVSAGGEVVAQPSEVQPGVVLADVADTEGSILTLSLATHD
jgi:hypothetical protein